MVRELQFNKYGSLLCLWTGDFGQINVADKLLRNFWNSGSFHSVSITQPVPHCLPQVLHSYKCVLFQAHPVDA